MTGVVHEKPNPPVVPKEEPRAEQASTARPAPPPASEPERAARKMDVDEDYDDSGEDEKKAVLTNGSGPSAASSDLKAPNSSVNVNVASGPAPKSE